MKSKRNGGKLITIVLFVIMIGIVAIAFMGTVNATTTQAPTVSKTVSPTDINIAGSGVNEETTVTITVEGAGGTSTDPVPMDVVFALDSSGSMDWNDPSGLRITASQNFVDLMDSSLDQGGIVSWDHKIDFTYGLTSDFATLKTKIGFI